MNSVLDAEVPQQASAGGAADSIPPEVSIIVPVYNTEATLPACLDSALAQTVPNIEVICVNDGSPDGAATVLEAYAARDSRVRVITQANAGLSAARNAGMDAARGRILVFLDSDDEIAPRLCERVLAGFAQAEDVDAVTYGAVCEPAERASKRIQQLLSPADALYRGFDPNLLFCANAQPYAWRTALLREFAERERIRFDASLRFAEDVPFHFTVYPLARTTVLLSDKLYRYRMVDGSLTHVYNAKTSRSQKIDQHLCVLSSIFDAWSQRSLGALCPERMVTWCLDFTLFDIMGLEREEMPERAARLVRLLEHAYGSRWYEVPRAPSVRKAARALSGMEALGELRFSKLDLMWFFVATRGVKQCVQRALRRG